MSKTEILQEVRTIHYFPFFKREFNFSFPSFISHCFFKEDRYILSTFSGMPFAYMPGLLKYLHVFWRFPTSPVALRFFFQRFLVAFDVDFATVIELADPTYQSPSPDVARVSDLFWLKKRV